jgi:hypothetical protein
MRVSGSCHSVARTRVRVELAVRTLRLRNLNAEIKNGETVSMPDGNVTTTKASAKIVTPTMQCHLIIWTFLQ